jgi:hypothetical protein
VSTTCKPSEVTRLWFDGEQGLTRAYGVSADLVAMPRIAGMPEHLRAIDFAPAMRVFMLRESGQAWREMTSTERALSLEFLAKIAEAVRGVVA